MHHNPFDVLGFWRQAGPGRWFAKDAAFDQLFCEHWQDAHGSAALRHLAHWLTMPHCVLALPLLSNQFPRNAFRGTAQMHATDSLAKHFALQAQHRGHMERYEPALRLFFCLPFAHSVDLADQNLSVQLHRALGEPWASRAQSRHDIVRRFGRFPHRNGILGRESKPEEQAFLVAGGFSG